MTRSVHLAWLMSNCADTFMATLTASQVRERSRVGNQPKFDSWLNILKFRGCGGVDFMICKCLSWQVYGYILGRKGPNLWLFMPVSKSIVTSVCASIVKISVVAHKNPNAPFARLAKITFPTLLVWLIKCIAEAPRGRTLSLTRVCLIPHSLCPRSRTFSPN